MAVRDIDRDDSSDRKKAVSRGDAEDAEEGCAGRMGRDIDEILGATA